VCHLRAEACRCTYCEAGTPVPQPMMEPTIYSKGLKLQAGPDARAFQVNGRHCLGILESYNSVTRRSFGEEFISHHKSMTEVLQADPSLIGAFFPHPDVIRRINLFCEDVGLWKAWMMILVRGVGCLDV
jgi:hypothetical protein